MMDKTDKILKQFGRSEVATVVPIGSDVIIPNNSAVKNNAKALYSQGGFVFNNGTFNFKIDAYVSSIPQIGTTTNNSFYIIQNNVRRMTFHGTQISIGVAYHAGAIFAVDSTTMAFLPPRMTTAQKNAVANLEEGMQVYDLDLHKMCVYTGAAWETITSA